MPFISKQKFLVIIFALCVSKSLNLKSSKPRQEVDDYDFVDDLENIEFSDLFSGDGTLDMSPNRFVVSFDVPDEVINTLDIAPLWPNEEDDNFDSENVLVAYPS